jgi:OFA family oxalate/formate antiporter-like MFS transporter
MQPDFPFRPASLPFFYGWVILGVSTLGIAMSIPGQTMGVSVFTDHLIGATGLSRLELSNAYLLGTLSSGLLLPYGGTLLDRFGARRLIVFVCLGLAGTLVYLANVDHLARQATAPLGLEGTTAAWLALALGFLFVRFSGQGMLTLLCRNMQAQWFERRRGLISAISGPVVNFAFAGAPLLLALWIARAGWRGAWTEMALVVAIGMGVIGWLTFRDTPEECGLAPDGAQAGADAEINREGLEMAAEPLESEDFTRAQALRTGAFWLVTLGIGNQALVGTGITFHIVDIGAEAGLSEVAAVAIFVPIAITSASLGFLAGAAIDRYPIPRLMMVMMVGQLIMFAGTANLSDPVLRVVAIGGWGLASSFYGPLTVAALPAFFGRTHLGSIQGVLMMCLVIASALGPSALALAKDSLGSYGPGLYGLMILPAGVLLACPWVQSPRRRAARSPRAPA